MRIPDELWPDVRDRELVGQTVDLFASVPLVLTDQLSNSVWFNGAAESLFGDRAEAIVNRAAWSLLGFGFAAAAPDRLMDALLGGGGPWKGMVRPEGNPAARPEFCEASALVRDGRIFQSACRIADRHVHGRGSPRGIEDGAVDGCPGRNTEATGPPDAVPMRVSGRIRSRAKAGVGFRRHELIAVVQIEVKVDHNCRGDTGQSGETKRQGEGEFHKIPARKSGNGQLSN